MNIASSTAPYPQAPMPAGALVPIRTRRIAGSGEKIRQFWRPSLHDFWAQSGSGAYVPHGTDTLTIGDQTAWVRSKLLLSDVVRIEWLELAPMTPENDQESAESALAQAIGSLVCNQRLLSYIEAQAVAGSGQNESASGFIRSIRQALEQGAPIEARSLAERGHAAYPDDPQLANFAAILAPPSTSTGPVASGADVSRAMAWVADHGAEHQGQWVALRGGELLGARSTLKDLRQAIGEMRGLFVTRIA